MRSERTRFSLLILLLGAISCLPAYPYGSEGHTIIGEIATNLLAGTRAEKEVKVLLGEKSLAEVSTWADKIKRGKTEDEGMNEFLASHRKMVEGRAEHSLFHYTDIPFQEAAYSEKSIGANPRDLVQSTRACVEILLGRQPHAEWFKNVPPRTALILMVHYIGDLHQPLHVGCAYVVDDSQFANPNNNPQAQSTRGGNLLEFSSVNLHVYWDSAVVKGAIRKAGFKDHPAEYGRTVAKALSLPQLPHGDPANWPEVWATKILPQAAEAYKGVEILGKSDDGKAWKAQLPPGYFGNSESAVEEQLKKGGIDLAQVLVAIWP